MENVVAPVLPTLIPNIISCGLLVLLGVLFNIVIKLQELEQQGQIISPWSYVKKKPYTNLMLLMSTMLLGALFYLLGQMTYVTALLLGIAADQSATRLRVKASSELDAKLIIPVSEGK